MVFGACWEDKRVESVQPALVPPITEHRKLQVGSGTGKVGMDCSAGGASDCETKLCLQSTNVKTLSAGRAGGYVCSTPCATRAQCPEEWICVQFYPGEGGRACVPPHGWAPHAANFQAGTR